MGTNLKLIAAICADRLGSLWGAAGPKRVPIPYTLYPIPAPAGVAAGGVFGSDPGLRVWPVPAEYRGCLP